MDSRKRTRVVSRKGATVTWADQTRTGELVNVSLKGCLLSPSGGDGPSVGSEIGLVIHLEPRTSEFDISVRCRVARCDSAGWALDFCEIAPDSFPHLFRLVQYNSPDPDGIEEEIESSAFSSPEG